MRIIGVLLAILFFGCIGDQVYSPKPRMYPRINFPAKENQVFDIGQCDFVFDLPTYFSYMQEEYFYEDKAAHPCWFDLEADTFNTSLHCSYYPLSTRAELNKLINDAFKVTNRHNVKADFIEDLVISRPEAEVYGLLFNVEGPVASPVQFYLTDSTSHFFRASLYFNSKVNPDSTAVVLDYLRSDINGMIGTWSWK